MKVAELTKYPKIFKNIYWGVSDSEGNEGPSSDEIIENRNAFVEEFNIIRTKRILKTIDEDLNLGNYNEFDHIESYYTIDKKNIIISSPYSPADKDGEFHLKKGFTQYKKLYHKDADTYIKIYDKRPYN